MVADKLAEFDVAEKKKALELSTSSGGLSTPSRISSLSDSHRRHRSSSSSLTNSPEGQATKTKRDGTSVVGHTLFEYTD